MLFEDRKDFTIKEGKRANGTPIWKVVLGKTETYTICRTLEEAQRQAKALNLDPFHFEWASMSSATINNKNAS
jgi:hypothetical protein